MTQRLLPLCPCHPISCNHPRIDCGCLLLQNHHMDKTELLLKCRELPPEFMITNLEQELYLGLIEAHQTVSFYSLIRTRYCTKEVICCFYIVSKGLAYKPGPHHFSSQESTGCTENIVYCCSFTIQPIYTPTNAQTNDKIRIGVCCCDTDHHDTMKMRGASIRCLLLLFNVYVSRVIMNS